MQPPTANKTANTIKDLFPNVNQAKFEALVQELVSGNYDADEVIVWANWYNGESQLFNLDALRTHFEAKQPKTNSPPDARTAAFHRQQQQNREAYAADAPARKQFDDFFAACSNEDLEGLKAEVLPTLDPAVAKMVADKSPGKSLFLKRLIWAHVQRVSKTQRD